MKIRLGELKRLIRETALTEISDPDKAHQHLVDLTQQALDNPHLGEHPLVGFLRTLGASKEQINDMRSAIKSPDYKDAIELAHQLATQLVSDAKSRVIRRPRQ